MGKISKEIPIGSTWKSNFIDKSYKILSSSYYNVEMYATDNCWDCIVNTKIDLHKYFTLVESKIK